MFLHPYFVKMVSLGNSENIFFLLFIISNYFGCFRDGIGADYFTYVMHFQNTSDITELTTSDFLLLEPGYVILLLYCDIYMHHLKSYLPFVNYYNSEL